MVNKCKSWHFRPASGNGGNVEKPGLMVTQRRDLRPINKPKAVPVITVKGHCTILSERSD